jgi:cytoskeletal protein CcmA (bactofilin family)
MTTPAWRRLGAALFLVGTFGLMGGGLVRAQSTVAADSDVRVAKGTVHTGNLYAFGEEVVIDGTVTGDVVGAGSVVRIGEEGRVRGDLLAAGYAVFVAGQVDGDVRAAGYMIEVGRDGQVGGEMAATGYSLGVAEGGSVAGDLLGFGYQLLLDGRVGQDLRFGGAAAEINGEVGGDARLTVAGQGTSRSRPFVPRFGSADLPSPQREVEPGLVVGDEAKVDGTLAYTSSTQARVPVSAQVGAVDYTPVAAVDTSRSDKPESPWWLKLLLSYVGLVLAGLLVFWLLPRVFGPMMAMLRTRPLPSLGYGLAAVAADLVGLMALLLAFVMALIIVFALQLGGTLGGPVVALFVVLGTLLTFGLLLVLFLGLLAAGGAMGGWLLRVGEQSTAGRRVGALLLGLAIVALLTAIPYGLGGLIGFVLSMAGLGALAMAWLRRGQAPAGAGTASTPVSQPGGA